MFEGRGKALSVPTELARMEELTDVTATGFTTDDIFAIVARHRDAPSAPPTATFYVLYLNGVYVEDGKENPGVLGIDFGGTGVVAMFNPVIESTSAGPGLNSNPDCVMNWTMDGTSGMVAFLKQHTLTNPSVLFGSECLANVDAVK